MGQVDTPSLQLKGQKSIMQNMANTTVSLYSLLPFLEEQFSLLRHIITSKQIKVNK